MLHVHPQEKYRLLNADFHKRLAAICDDLINRFSPKPDNKCENCNAYVEGSKNNRIYFLDGLLGFMLLHL